MPAARSHERRSRIAGWQVAARFYRDARGTLAAATTLWVAQAVVLLPVPLLFMRAFDELRPGGTASRVVLLAGTVLLLQLSSAGLAAMARRLSLRVGKGATLEMRRAIIDRIYAMPRTALEDRGVAPLHDLVVHDTERIDLMANVLVATVLPAVCLGVGIAVVLASLDVRFFLVTTSVFPAIAATSFFLKVPLKRTTAEFHRAYERFSRGVLFVLETMDLTRAQGAEDDERRRQDGVLVQLWARSTAMAWKNAAYANLQGVILGAISVVVLVAGAQAVTRGTMSLGGLVSFFVGLALLRTPLGAGLQSLPQVLDGAQALQRVAALLDSGERLPYEGTESLDFRGRVAIEEVSFRYSGAPILTRVSLRLEPGSAVGLVGPSGAGKSTLIMLLLGFYRPESGRITFDGIPLERLDLTGLRRQISVLPQEPYVFAGTLWENMTYGLEDVPEDEIRAAARVALVDEFVSCLPQAYDTPVGDRGMRLSGGQRQRVALARALARRPALLMLDEPTNHLDSVAVEQLLERIRGHCPHSTVLVISHDRRVLGELDAIHSLRDGGLSLQDSGDPAGVSGNESAPAWPPGVHASDGSPVFPGAGAKGGVTR